MVDNSLATGDDPVAECHINDQLFLYAVCAGNDNIRRQGPAMNQSRVMHLLLDIGLLNWGSPDHQLSNSGPTPSVPIHYAAVLGNKLLLRLEREECCVSGLCL